MDQQAHHILLISPEYWGKNRLSKHHYASFLAENNTVVFLSPAVGFSRIPFGNMELKAEQATENLSIVTYKNCLPRLNHWPHFIQKWVYKIQSKRILKFIGFQPDLVWSFDRHRFRDQHVWGTKNTIYHAVDLHPDFYEKQIISTSHFIIGLSEIICNDLKKSGADPFQTGHGCHVDITNRDYVTLPGENAIKAIYTGNFHNDVDYALLIRLAVENPACDFILIGPTKSSNISAGSTNKEDLQKLKVQKNIFLLGSVPGKELHKYLNAADICLVLFKKEVELLHHAPHKIMGYLASGNIILANHMAGHAGISEELIIMVEQAQIPERFTEIASHLHEFNSEEKKQMRRNFAAANHYRIKISQILGKLFA